MKIALLFGGPSLERGISLNSARSVLDHLENVVDEIIPIYYDQKKRPYRISSSQLYSNTPSDFDFKLAQHAKAISEASLVRLLKKVDITMPVMHGEFGEDGTIQRWLEKHRIPFVGSASAPSKLAFDKYTASQTLREHGYKTLPQTLLKIYDNGHDKNIQAFFKKYDLKKVIVKPASGGSSIGTFVANTPAEALAHAKTIFSKRIDTRVVVEQFANGAEFTVIVMQNSHGLPVALVPTEIETANNTSEIFDYRKKYLPTNQVRYHCPPRFSIEVSEQIQAKAENIFTLFGMSDYARFDGWLLDDGTLIFSDFNPISGMEQNSFLFQQGSRIGFTHSTFLQYVISSSLSRYGKQANFSNTHSSTKRKPINVLFGGSTSERQVSLMSGTNVWLKLRKSTKYQPEPYLLTSDGHVWHLPYTLTLNHTVEEIIETCESIQDDRGYTERLESRARARLEIQDDAIEPFFIPKKIPLQTFIKNSPYVFLALHGGDGEDGLIQAKLKKAGKLHNGSNSATSAICMDKFVTGTKIEAANIPGLRTTQGVSLSVQKYISLNPAKLIEVWNSAVTNLDSHELIIKPRADGCSSGIIRLNSSTEFINYIHLLREGVRQVTPNTFYYQPSVVEMPTETPKDVLLEPFIETDHIRAVNNTLKHSSVSGWIETTVGVLEHNKAYHVLSPSVTVTKDHVLSVEEKFQGGTGVNLTPPPASIITAKALQKVKQHIGSAAKVVGIQNYCRIDAFVHRTTGDVKVIEINTLPALTPSTVLYHQALAEPTPIRPVELLELLVKNSGY